MLKNRFQPFQVGLNYETLEKHTRKRKTLHMVKVHVRRNDMTGNLMDLLISQFKVLVR